MKRKPARIQKDPETVDPDERPPQNGTVFNIWYLKWSGGDREGGDHRKAEGRCQIGRDSGYTRADKQPGGYICLYFARGMCINGKKCEFLHRLPNDEDTHIHGTANVDCFGRDKFADYRDDMGGVGSFLRHNRTLYIGQIAVTDNMEEIVSRHFSEWGKIERIRVLNNRGVAFVTYVNEASAQFAKEAMAHQSLDNDEVLSVRWAIEDPNPRAQKREQRRIQEQAAEVIRKSIPESILAEIEGRSVKRQRTALEDYKGVIMGSEYQDDEKELMQEEKHGEESPANNRLSEGTENDAKIGAERSRGLISTATLKELHRLGRMQEDDNLTEPERKLDVDVSSNVQGRALVDYDSD